MAGTIGSTDIAEQRVEVAPGRRARVGRRALTMLAALAAVLMLSGVLTSCETTDVGRGGTIYQVHGAYLASAGHRRNILDPAFSQVGAGAVWGTCNGYRTVFTVQVFMRG